MSQVGMEVVNRNPKGKNDLHCKSHQLKKQSIELDLRIVQCNSIQDHSNQMLLSNQVYHNIDHLCKASNLPQLDWPLCWKTFQLDI